MNTFPLILGLLSVQLSKISAFEWIQITIKITVFGFSYLQCGQELGETLLNLSRAWEAADTSTSHAFAKQLPGLGESLTGNAKSGKNEIICNCCFRCILQILIQKPISISL